MTAGLFTMRSMIFVAIPSVPSDPDKNSRQIVSRAVHGPAAKMHNRSIGQHYLKPEHMSSRESVFQAMCAARVLRHISADAAHRLRRRIGSVEVAMRSHTLRNIGVDDARLHDHARIRQVHFQDAIHAG